MNGEHVAGAYGGELQTAATCSFQDTANSSLAHLGLFVPALSWVMVPKGESCLDARGRPRNYFRVVSVRSRAQPWDLVDPQSRS